MLKLLKKKIPKENIHYVSLFLKYVSTKNLVVLKKKIESLNIEQADYSQTVFSVGRIAKQNSHCL